MLRFSNSSGVWEPGEISMGEEHELQDDTSAEDERSFPTYTPPAPGSLEVQGTLHSLPTLPNF